MSGAMRVRSSMGMLWAMVHGVIGAQAAVGQVAVTVDNIWQYATACYQRVGIDPDALKGPFTCKNTHSKELFTKVNGVVKDLPGVTAFPAACDMPAWLTDKCYGNSYIQTLDTGNRDVKAALLCRHKTVWTDDQKKYDDIAMIVHNRRNGQTCWFQTEDGPGVERDGTAVPGPATVRDHDFWLDAEDTAGIECIRCHDSGPWMNSTWMYDAIKSLKDGKGAYVNEGDHFDQWPNPVFVTVAGAGLPPKHCSHCHKIAAADTTAKGRKFNTCKQWIEFTTGRAHPAKRNAFGRASMDIAYWMPRNHRKGNAVDWKAAYDTHVDKLVACCEAKGVGVADCSVYTPTIRVSAATRPAVQIEGSLDGGASFPYYVSEPWQEDPPVFQVPTGSELTLRWGSPQEQYYCALEATFPPGVSVNGISTASNFSLDQGYPYMLIGNLYEPGDYRFDLICDEDGDPRVANVIFNVYDESGGGPGPYLYLQTLVNGDPGDPANTRPGPESTEDWAITDDHVDLHWATSGVVPDSCEVQEVLRGQESWHADSGFESLDVAEPGDRKYVLTCIGLDGLGYDVDVTLHVEGGAQEPTNLFLQAIVDGDPGAAATIIPGPEQAEDSATTSSEVYLTWSSENVQPGSCTVHEVLRGEGSWHVDWGLEPLSLPDAGDRQYVLTCTGLDNLPYDVELLLHVAGSGGPGCLPVPWPPFIECAIAS